MDLGLCGIFLLAADFKVNYQYVPFSLRSSVPFHLAINVQTKAKKPESEEKWNEEK